MGTMATPFKHKKTGVYYCRVSVPKELRNIVGKTELKRSLHTKDLNQAKRLFPAVYSEFNCALETAKRKLETELEIKKRKTTAPDKLTMIDIQVLASRYFNNELEVLRSHETFCVNAIAKYDLILVKLGNWKGNSEVAIEDFDVMFGGTEDSSARPLQHDRLEALVECLGEVTDNLLADNGYAIPRESKYYQKLIQTLALKVQKLSQVAMQYYSNNFDDSGFEALAYQDTTPPLNNQTVTTGTKPRELFDRYEEDLRLQKQGQEKTLKRTIKDYEVVIKRFIEFSNNKSIEDVNSRDIAEFRDLLLRLPSRPSKNVASMPLLKQVEYAKANNLKTLAPKTVRKLLMALSAIFEFAKEQTLIEINPVHGSAKRLSQTIKQRSGKEKEYTKEDLLRIFNSPIYTDSYRPPRADYGEAVYWLPLLAYYTGARREELAQLYTLDIKEINGIHYFDLEANDDDKSLKNCSSVRKVPIHNDLIDLGFLSYIKSLKNSKRLFPKLTIGGDGTYGDNVGDWLGLYFRNKLKVNSQLRPIHAFRHTFKTNARLVGMSKDVHDTITGHNSGDVSSSYGHYPLELLHQEINRVPSIPVELNRIKWKQY